MNRGYWGACCEILPTLRNLHNDSLLTALHVTTIVVPWKMINMSCLTVQLQKKNEIF